MAARIYAEYRRVRDRLLRLFPGMSRTDAARMASSIVGAMPVDLFYD